MTLLFEDQLRAEQRLEQKHIDALARVVQSGVAPAQITSKTPRSQMGVYKDERLLTVYSLQALQAGHQADHTSATAWHSVLQRAFAGRFARVADHVGAHPYPAALQFEVDLQESPYIRAVMAQQYAEDPPHPVLYVRKWAGPKVGNDKAHWEGATQSDCRAIWGAGLDHQRLYVEAKFLSDVSTSTKYNCARNQAARSIEAGLWDTARTWVGGPKDQIDSETISRFWFMMLTPELFRTDMPTARLYGFLMDQYRRDPSTLQRDLPHLPLDASDWAALSERVGWATWEDCRQAIVTRQGNDHPSTRDAQLAPDVFGQLEQFYADRRVFLLPRVSVWMRHKGTEQALDVVDVADLQAQLRSRRIRRVLLAHRNPLTDGITHPQADTAVDGLDTTHLDWIGGGDGRMLDCR